MAKSALKTWRGTGRNDDAVRTSYVAKPVRKAAVEEISVTGIQHANLVRDRDFDDAFNDHAGFLSLVR